eukprot:GHVN01056769.1.p1 GENE.GHVN01056769.1~~GHVN01056769.1.p1  ORF type:complete len:143 (+),score=13.45 GHVN01056769.1:26-454(+)
MLTCLRFVFIAVEHRFSGNLNLKLKTQFEIKVNLRINPNHHSSAEQHSAHPNPSHGGELISSLINTPHNNEPTNAGIHNILSTLSADVSYLRTHTASQSTLNEALQRLDTIEPPPTSPTTSQTQHTNMSQQNYKTSPPDAAT